MATREVLGGLIEIMLDLIDNVWMKNAPYKYREEVTRMKTTLLILVMLLMSSCSKTNNWPDGMTPFFAECEGTQNVYTDKSLGKKKTKSL